MKQLDFNLIEKNSFNRGNSLRKLLKVSLDLFEARHTGILSGTNHTHIKFLPTSMWDRGVMDRFDGRGIAGLVLKLFGVRVVTARGLSPVMFHKHDEFGNLSDNDGIIAYVFRNCVNYYKKGISVIICPETDKYTEKSDELFFQIPFYIYNGKTIFRSENDINVDTRIVRHFNSKNSIYIYLPDYGVLVINTANVELLETSKGLFVNQAELIQRLDILIQLVEEASLDYLGHLTGKKGARLLWRKEKHLRRTSRELMDNERRYRDLYENAPIAYISLDPGGTILKCNQKAEELSGYRRSQLIGLNAKNLFIQEEHAQQSVSSMLSRLDEGQALKDMEIRITLKGGELLWVSLSVDAVKDRKGNIVELRMMILDISKRKSLERQLRQSQKMEAIGTLAGGIAHDFNNILSPISGYTEMLLLDTANDQPRKKQLTIILECANHAKNLVSQILTFSRKKEHSMVVLDTARAVEKSMTLVRSVMPATIKIKVDIDPQCPAILADPIQLHQVIMNLVSNAYQAMQQPGGGILQIRLKKVKSIGGLKSVEKTGAYVRLSISDTGGGIKKEILDKIFDPYFSTKKESEASGIGLSVVHGIVQSHGGQITVESEEGNGTRFDIYFPVSREQASPETDSNSMPMIEKGFGSILLVDDDGKVAAMETHMLEKLGYSVTCFTKSLEAVKALETNAGQYDLVLTDMTMPGLTGLQLAERIYKLNPDMPIILCSGLGETMEKKKFNLPSIKAVLKKPVSVQKLSQVLQRTLSDS